MNRQEWQRRQQSAAPTASDIDAIRHQEISNYLRELRALLVDIKELLSDHAQEHERWNGDHR
jgi:hypothetical protein